MRTRLAALFVALALVALTRSGAWAQSILIDFEQLPGMSNAPGAAIPAQSRLSDAYLASHGIRFSSGSPYIAVVVHGASTPSGTQIIGGSTPDGRLTYQNTFPIVAEFFNAAGTVPYAVSKVSIMGDLTCVSGTKTLEAFDVHGTMLGSVQQPDCNFAPMVITAAGIHRVRMYSQSATVGFDDLRFDTPAPISGTCPADLNLDGFVDDSDFVIFLASYNILDCADPDMTTGCPSDFNADNLVDDADFVIFVAAYNELVCP
ncbi:MAG: hypothetical protein U0570_04200 [Phycisphaerales bacterium]